MIVLPVFLVRRGIVVSLSHVRSTTTMTAMTHLQLFFLESTFAVFPSDFFPTVLGAFILKNTWERNTTDVRKNWTGSERSLVRPRRRKSPPRVAFRRQLVCVRHRVSLDGDTPEDMAIASVSVTLCEPRDRPLVSFEGGLGYLHERIQCWQGDGTRMDGAHFENWIGRAHVE